MTQFKLGVLGSVHESRPQAALVGIAVTPQLEIIFDTVSGSRKYRNLCARPACSFVVGWAGEQTVQYEGKARRLEAPELEPYQNVYFKAWPECLAHRSWSDVAYFAVRPTWIRFSDFDKRPPLVEEFLF
jgi:pyridoxine/pyridoxamine 5'-phosphate oxidase